MFTNNPIKHITQDRCPILHMIILKHQEIVASLIKESPDSGFLPVPFYLLPIGYVPSKIELFRLVLFFVLNSAVAYSNIESALNCYICISFLLYLQLLEQAILNIYVTIFPCQTTSFVFFKKIRR